MVFEDLHWADDALLDFVESLADGRPPLPIMVIGVARPELLERRPALASGLGTLVVYTAGTAHSKVSLSGLDYDVARRIRTHLLPDAQSDAV